MSEIEGGGDPIASQPAQAAISRHFAWKEALWLPRWNRMADLGDGLGPAVEANLKVTFAWMDKVREFFDTSIIVHCAYRPTLYNRLVGGAKKSAHLLGRAVDFHVEGVECEAARQALLPELEALGLCMENHGPTANWIHLDDMPARKSGRYFVP